MKRLAALVLVLILGGAFTYHNFFHPLAGLQAYTDAEYLRIAPTLDGKLTSLAVSRGGFIAKNAVLFSQDNVPDRAARDQAQAALAQARAQLKNLQDKAKDTEIAAKRADVADTEAEMRRSRADLARIASLIPNGAATRENYDAALQTASSATARLDAARARLTEAEAPSGRTQEIEAAANGVAMAQAALDNASWRLAQRDVLAPAAGRITDIFIRPGETAMANAPVVELLPPENILVRFFVSESDIGSWHVGDAIKILCDGCAQNIDARVTYIAPRAEFTPPVIYSNETRAKLVFMLEARPNVNDAQKLNPGQPVRVLRGTAP
jgi:HlyD family secretion protein